MKLRRAAVAGSFYPSTKSELSSMVEGCYLHFLGPGRAPPAPASDANVVAVVSPHAGYEYSGPVAAHSYLHVSSLRAPDLIVIVAPNHYGVGSGVATFKDGEWETPLGRMRVDEEAASKLVRDSGIVAFDPEAHQSGALTGSPTPVPAADLRRFGPNPSCFPTLSGPRDC